MACNDCNCGRKEHEEKMTAKQKLQQDDKSNVKEFVERYGFDTVTKCGPLTDTEKLMVKGYREDQDETRKVNDIAEKGSKFDNSKPPLSIIPREALEGCANAFAYGARKYSKNNFKNGIEITRLIDAAMRHLTAYVNGESQDPESLLSHLDHSLASIAMAKFMEVNKPEMDDRYGPDKERYNKERK